MRINRLELLRYGHFTDRILELPAGDPDIHIVFGPNEAGKSTALMALEDLLFGVPRNSPLNFIHDYQAMRLGAEIQAGQQTLSFRRRKGNKDTVLTPDDVPMPGGDGTLATCLAGANREFFVRMFFLDHNRLREGGREILAARDDVGQALFSAGAGLEGLRENLHAMNEEASALWAPRKAAHRLYYQAEEQLKGADAELRAHTVTERDWMQRKRALEAADADFSAIEAEIHRGEKALRKLNRIRRVYRDVARQQDLQADISALGPIKALPEDAAAMLDKAEREDRDSDMRIKTLRSELTAAQEERESLTCDDALLLRADDIEQLHERRIRVRAGKADLPERRFELAAAERQLLELARELGWQDDDIVALMARMPARTDLSRTRALLNQHAEVRSEIDSSTRGLQEAEERLARIDQQLQALPAPGDEKTQQALVRATRDSGDIDSQAGAAGREAAHAQSIIDRCLARLQPAVDTPDAAITLPVPPRDAVEHHREQARDLSQRRRECQENASRAEQERDRLQQARDRLIGEQLLVTPEELARLREHRDAGWSLVRRRHIDGASFNEDELTRFSRGFPDLSAAYEAAVAAADGAADRRFEHAEETAELSLLSRRLDEQQSTLQACHARAQALGAEEASLQASWQTLWTEAPFEPGPPEVMLDWLATRSELIAAVDQRNHALEQVAALTDQQKAATDRLNEELGRLGMDTEPLRQAPLAVVLQAATDWSGLQEKVADNRMNVTEQLQVAQQDAERKGQQSAAARERQIDWQTIWQQALTAIGLNTAADPGAIASQIEVLDSMRELVLNIRELREERIGRIEAFIREFQDSVADLVSAVGPGLEGTDAEAAVLTLEGRLKEAERIREALADKDKRIEKLRKDIEQLEGARRDSLGTIQHLKEQAGVDTLDALTAAIANSDRHRALQEQSALLAKSLEAEGDGFDLAHLQAECADVDLDEIVAEENGLNGELQELRERLMDARETRTGARQAFDAIGGDDAAARAAADRQSALASMEEVAARYVRLRAAALLLQWGIDRYRREKQAPMLSRAGGLFATLTGNSFSALKLEFDDQDAAHLAGVRPDGSTVGVEGMSTGTADQLYMALRVAAIEDYVARSGPLPFVADDLFINFDDDRAAAGFAVLGELARSCQVIFFTHHVHLLEIAKSTLADGVSAIHLAE